MGRAYYVSVYGNDANDGLSWEHAKRHIQNMINATTNGDTINVEPGTYKENLQIEKSIQLIGVNKNAVILDGDQKGRCIDKKKCDILIYGFTITNGKAFDGGGINNEYGILKIEDSQITNNNAKGSGAGIVNSNRCSLTITNCQITNNIAQNAGAGIRNFGNVTIKESKITGNTANGDGGGIYNWGEGFWDLFTKQNTINNKPDNVYGHSMKDI